MRGNRAFAGAVLASMLVHGWLLWRYSPQPLPATPPVVLDVVIEPVSDVVPEIDVPEEIPVRPEVTVSEKQPPTRAPVVQPVVSVPAPSVLDEEIETSGGATILNLERPADWDDIVNSLPAPGHVLPFNPGLSEGVALRAAEKKRQGLISARTAAVYGVADEAFDREGGLGREKKMDGQCYVLVDDPSVEQGSRWWASQCKDTKTNALSLDPVEYDAVGRIIAP